MDNENLDIEELKKSGYFTDHIRWEITPRIFISPQISDKEKIDTSYGYMLYVDLVDEKPAIVVMQLKEIISKTVGYITEAPIEMMEDAINRAGSECVSGMCPLTDELKDWLKKEMGVS